MVEKEKSAEALQYGSGNWAPGYQIPDVVTVRQMATQHAPEVGKVCRMDRDGVARGEGFIERLIEARIERFFVVPCHCNFREVVILKTLQRSCELFRSEKVPDSIENASGRPL
jgi:hypothetical protein